MNYETAISSDTNEGGVLQSQETYRDSLNAVFSQHAVIIAYTIAWQNK